MYLPDSEAFELRKWLIQRLEALEAVADADVLADFVIALLRTDTEEQQLKQDAHTELEDFLKQNTQTFLDLVFSTVKSKSYLPGYVASVDPPVTSTLPLPTRTGVLINTDSNPSKKRSYNDMQEGPRDPSVADGSRQMKQARRGGRGRGGSRRGRETYHDMDSGFDHTMQQPLQYAGQTDAPMKIPDFPLDQFPDPFTAMASLQAMGFGGVPQPHNTNSVRKKKGRCRDYDTKGFCTRGNTCPYQHGDDHVVFPGADEYDPRNPTGSSTVTNGHSQANGRGRGRGSRSARGGRADVSHIGPLHDRTATAIVIEHIPEDKFSEEAVRHFFSEFGTIQEVTLQSYKRLAIVKYSDHAAAQKAYESPKVIFDNRFVKVYWQKLDKPPPPAAEDTTNGNMHEEESPKEEPFDREDFERKSQEAQRKLEEKKAQMKEMAAQREKLQERAEKQAEEKKALLEKLAAKAGASSPDVDMADSKENVKENNDATVNANTRALRAKVAELEAEAKSLGIDHNSSTQAWSPRGRGRGRGRGSYRGWEGFGSGTSYSSSPRGRGGYRGWSGGGKYNLDLRTKKVEIAGAAWTSEHDEALRQHLLGVGAYESIESHPEKSDAVIVTFQDRPTAEIFFFGSREIANVGKLEFAWCNLPHASNGAQTKAVGHNDDDTDGDVGMRGSDGPADINGGTGDVDYDVAEEDDRWR